MFGYSFNYLRIIPLEGDHVIVRCEYPKGVKAVGTGACSLRMLTGLDGLSIRDFNRCFPKILEDFDQGEPVNILGYMDPDENADLLNHLVNKVGFTILENLPGGHNRYEMVLICYMHNPHIYSNEEEKQHAAA